MAGEDFGVTGEGKPVHRLSISGGGLSAQILTLGAIVQDLRLAGHPDPLVLGYETLDDYLVHSPYFGAIVGRYANRIAGGRFVVDGERFATDRNDRGNTLHGGSEGLDRRVWRVEAQGGDFVTLAILDPDGEMGFPGNLDIRCTYRLKWPGTLSVELSATTDAPTPCNLAHHSYFNLNDGGRTSILDHRMTISAHAYLPIDETGIPTGAAIPVQGTRYDFILPRTIRLDGEDETLYDHNFCLTAAREPLRQVAWAQGTNSGVEMEVWTTEPGLQFFTGQFPDRETPGLEGRAYKSFAGFCLEPQFWPDAPNRPYFPNATLRPGEEYRQHSEFRFRLPQDV
ncbi:aldose epimerase family protein [Aquamicrobium sp. LC103]|uniref:aldose epimerase family protein n=1 Tax=Aquamicrobium sp. LC103 TaxID=1120658 RepID=UPI00063E987B|nr:aldose epimerase family protein [Aquamicrobium sp. LC103]TKT79122.1 galactose mutarotase [Aquamicrobium sp. LC103]